MHAAQRQHLGAVFRRGDVAHRLALHPHRRLLGSEIAVGVDFHFYAAVAEDALGDDGDHVDAVVPGRDDEGGRLVVWIGRGSADTGDEGALALAQFAAPATAALDEGNARHIGLRQQHQGVDSHQPAFIVGIAVAGAGTPRPDAAQHRTGVATHDTGSALGFGERNVVAHATIPFRPTMASRRRCGNKGTRRARTPVA